MRKFKGCNWQKKSFTVSAREIRESTTCEKCGQEIKGAIYIINDTRQCKPCFTNSKME